MSDMSAPRTDQPTPLAIAQILESTLLSEGSYVESLPALKWMLRHGERSRELFDELTRPREDAPSLLELARLFQAVSDRGFDDTYDTALWVVQQDEEGRRAYEELLRLTEDAGDVVEKHRLPITILQRHREVDTLLASEDWDDPKDVLDPSGDSVNGEAYRHWLAICVARRQRGEGDPDRLDTAIRKIRQSGQRASYVGNLLKRIEGVFPVFEALDDAHGVLKGVRKSFERRGVWCSFCNRGEPLVRRLVPGPDASKPTVFICDECVGTCVAVINESKSGEASADQGEDVHA